MNSLQQPSFLYQFEGEDPLLTEIDFSCLPSLDDTSLADCISNDDTSLLSESTSFQSLDYSFANDCLSDSHLKFDQDKKYSTDEDDTEAYFLDLAKPLYIKSDCSVPVILKENELDVRYPHFQDLWSIPAANTDKQPRPMHLSEQSASTSNTSSSGRLPYNGFSNHKYVSSNHIQEVDVLFGRGKKSNNHPGNKYYRELIVRLSSHYKDCSRAQKTALSTSVVEAIHKKGGRFLTPVSNKSNLWVEMTGLALRKKTSQAMRDSNTYRT